MSTKLAPGEAYTRAAKKRETDQAKRNRLLREYEKREAARLRDQQRLLRAAFLARQAEREGRQA